MDFGICVASHVGDIDYVVRAEALGYSHAWFADSQMLWSDCYAALALAATRTSRIRLGTGVAITGTRPASVNAAGIAIEHLLGEEGDVESVGNDEVVPRVRCEAAIRLLYPVAGDVEGELHLVDCVAANARHGERRPAQDDGLGCPRVRHDPRECKLDREPVPVLLDVRIHTLGVRREDPPGVGVVVRPLAVVEGSPKHHQARAPVVGERFRSEDFREAALVPAPPHLHLPEPVLRHDVALRAEEIVIVAGVDVRDPPLVADDLHRLPEPGKGELPVKLSERAGRELVERSGYAGARGCRASARHESGCEEGECRAFHPEIHVASASMNRKMPPCHIDSAGRGCQSTTARRAPPGPSPPTSPGQGTPSRPSRPAPRSRAPGRRPRPRRRREGAGVPTRAA